MSSSVNVLPGPRNNCSDCPSCCSLWLAGFLAELEDKVKLDVVEYLVFAEVKGDVVMHGIVGEALLGCFQETSSDGFRLSGGSLFLPANDPAPVFARKPEKDGTVDCRDTSALFGQDGFRSSDGLVFDICK